MVLEVLEALDHLENVGHGIRYRGISDRDTLQAQAARQLLYHAFANA